MEQATLLVEDCLADPGSRELRSACQNGLCFAAQ